MDGFNIIFIPREQQRSKYDWADIVFGDCNVGKARCSISSHDFIIYSILIYPEFQGKEYGKKFVEFAKLQHNSIIADRVRFEAIGFWENVGFIKDGDTDNWIYADR